MKKEVLIAILLGLAVGLIITYGLYRVRSSISQSPVAELEELASAAATLVQSSPTTITILNPEEGAVLPQQEVTVTGNTTPNAYVVLFVNDKDSVSTADDIGNFSFDTQLADGVNVLRVHVVDSDGTTTTSERVVVVSSIFENTTPAASESAETTEQ